MTTVSGVIACDNVQVDGRHSVREIWTDDLGYQYIFDYMSDIGTDVNAVMNARYDSVLQQAIDYQAALSTENY